MLRSMNPWTNSSPPYIRVTNNFDQKGNHFLPTQSAADEREWPYPPPAAGIRDNRACKCFFSFPIPLLPENVKNLAESGVNQVV